MWWLASRRTMFSQNVEFAAYKNTDKIWKDVYNTLKHYRKCFTFLDTRVIMLCRRCLAAKIQKFRKWINANNKTKKQVTKTIKQLDGILSFYNIVQAQTGRTRRCCFDFAIHKMTKNIVSIKNSRHTK